jgi:hypothetical protein
MASKGKGRKRNNDNKREMKAVAAGVLPLSNNELINAQELTTEADPASPSSKKSKKNTEAQQRGQAQNGSGYCRRNAVIER